MIDVSDMYSYIYIYTVYTVVASERCSYTCLYNFDQSYHTTFEYIKHSHKIIQIRRRDSHFSLFKFLPLASCSFIIAPHHRIIFGCLLISIA